jgi:hypothetical protein
MILEGLVTTVSAQGVLNVAPMGPQVEPLAAGQEWTQFVLRPFRTSQTCANLLAHGEGVLHVTDDVLLLARAAIGPLDPMPALEPARHVKGWVLADTCRYPEFRVLACDDREERVRFDATIVHTGRRRDFFGFNRAKHAVLEAAILASRVHLLESSFIEAEYRRLATLVEKTGGPQEHEALALLKEFVQTHRG